MKIRMFVLFAIAAILASSLFAEDGKKYGAGVTLKKATKISEILKNPKEYVGKKVMVSGTVVGVCEHKGCWIDIAGDKEFEKMKIKVKDGEIVFPLTAKGKQAMAEGIFEEINISKEQLIETKKKQAKERGTKFDPASVKGPMTIYRIKGTGAVIK
ncbi:MAG TPA: DUF4920 domain-containing protein [Bacteroidetes bacterium]|nr:DUF4920 domain-containing protein [Bacteroidota bacterium]